MPMFEIRLREIQPPASLIFATVRETDGDAAEYARTLLKRFPEFEFAEIWDGMRMLRQV
jgi:hypothetical protein